MGKTPGAQSGGSTAPEIDEKINGYIDRLGDFLRQCADDVEDRPDAFLWNARRALEAMLLAIYTKDGNAKAITDTATGKLLDHFEAKERVIAREVLGALRVLQSEGNLGAHLQGHERMAYDGPVGRCRHSLVDAVRWFYNSSNVGPRTIPPAIEATLLVFKGDKRPPPEIAREQQASELKSATERLKALRNERDTAKREAEVARNELAELRRGAERADATSEATSHAGPASEDAGARRVGIGGAVAIAGVAAIAGAVITWSVFQLGAPSAVPVGPTTAASTQVVDASDGHDVLVPNLEASGAVAADAGSGSDGGATSDTDASSGSDTGTRTDKGPATACPNGMLPFPGDALSFDEPEPRPSLGLTGPRKTGLHASVTPFCLDRVAMSAKDFPLPHIASMDDTERARRSTCRPPRKSKLLMNCVTHEEASAACSARGARLPKLIEWEYLARTGKERSLDVAPASEEWIEDRFPSPSWGRRTAPPPDDARDFLTRRKRSRDADAGEAEDTWMRRPGTDWAGDRVFRCALDVK